MRHIVHRCKAGMASLLALAMLLGLLPAAAMAAESNSFTDTANHWGKASIDRVVAEGLFTGISDSTFNPDGSMTRSMFVTVLQRMADKLKGPAPTGAAVSFADVPSGSWYAAGVDWAVRSGVTTGYGSGLFGPDDLVTREQMCVFLIRFLGDYMGYELTSFKPGAKFDDDAAISDWAKEAVYLAQAMGLVQGVGGNTFGPQSSADRASVAVIADRLLDKVETLTIPVTPSPSPSPKPGSGGGGGGGGGGGSSIALTSVYIVRDGVNMSGLAVKSGDVLYANVTPANAVYTLSWTVGGVEKGTAATYAVVANDAGKTVTLAVTGTTTGTTTGGYTGTVTSLPTGLVAAVVDPGETNPDKAPVVIAPGATYTDAEGKPVTIPEGAELTLDIKTSADAVVGAPKDALEQGITDLFAGSTVKPEKMVGVDVDLTMSAGETSSKIHAVGTTTVTLSRETLGLSADLDLTLYAFVANHTNAAGTVETVKGEVVNEGNSVRFTLNGLSRIYIGNVPPLTVKFDTDGGSAIADQKVKLGELAQRPVNPTKSGYLFTGWDHDLGQTKIINDITFKAQWIQGAYAADDRLSVVEPDSGAIHEPGNVGTMKIALSDEEVYTPNQIYTLRVTAVLGAASYTIGDTAEAASNSTEAHPLTNNCVDVSVPAANADGKAIPGKTTTYIKWLDADKKPLALESASLIIWTESYDEGQYETEIREVNKPMNRGIGTFEVMLSGKDKPDFLAYINGNMSNTEGNYQLNINASVDEGRFSYQGVSLSDYSALKVVFTPFEGESYSGAVTASAYYWDENDEKVTVPVSAALGTDGKVTVTTEDITALTALADPPQVYFTVKMSGKTQNLSIGLHRNSDTKYTSIDCSTWAEVVTALAQSDKNRVNYTGKENVTLTTSLTIPADKDLGMGRAGLIIGKGGVLTLASGVNNAANVNNASFLTVADGGKLLVGAHSENQNSYWHANINVNTLTVQSGGLIDVPAFGFLGLYVYQNNSNNPGPITIEAGGEVRNSGNLLFNGLTTLAGSLTTTGNGAERKDTFYGDTEFRGETTISGTVTVENKGYFEVVGGATIAETGKINLNSGWVDLTGILHNNGAINVNGGELFLSNMGYSAYNAGTIAIASGADTIIWGTVLVNTGSITGPGTLTIEVADDVITYDNALQYVEVEGEETPSNYSRYKFTHDPAATVDVTYFVGELSIQDNGTCTATLNDKTVTP